MSTWQSVTNGLLAEEEVIDPSCAAYAPGKGEIHE